MRRRGEAMGEPGRQRSQQAFLFLVLPLAASRPGDLALTQRAHWLSSCPVVVEQDTKVQELSYSQHRTALAPKLGFTVVSLADLWLGSELGLLWKLTMTFT